MSSGCMATGFTRAALRRTSRNSPLSATRDRVRRRYEGSTGERLGDEEGTHLSECCKRPGKSSFRRVQRATVHYALAECTGATSGSHHLARGALACQLPARRGVRIARLRERGQFSKTKSSGWER